MLDINIISCQPGLSCPIPRTAAPRHQPGVAILRSRGAGPRQGSLASQQHFNIKNIYGAESNKGIKAKAY